MKGAVLEACDCVRKAQLEEGFGTYEDRFLTNQSHEIYEVTAAHLNTEDHVVEAMLDETDVAGTSAHKSRSAATWQFSGYDADGEISSEPSEHFSH